MRANVISAILMTLSLGVFGAEVATAQHADHSTRKDSQSVKPGKEAQSHDQMMMANEPHQVLAMAYHKNMAAFAKALQGQTAQTSSVNVEFARTAVTEMRRSFDQMKQHHKEHMRTMSAEMQTKMSGMMQQMATHQAEMNTQLTSLEQEVVRGTPDAKKVSTLAASVRAHLDAMSKKHKDSMEKDMKMKKKAMQ